MTDAENPQVGSGEREESAGRGKPTRGFQPWQLHIARKLLEIRRSHPDHPIVALMPPQRGSPRRRKL